MTKKEVLEKGEWPQEFLANLVSDVPDIKINSHTKLKWLCEEHGIYEQEIGSHLAGRRCPKCGVSDRIRGMRDSKRDRNRFPQWFIDDLEGSPDKEAVLNGTLKSHDKAQFYCPEHGFYSQLINSHLRGHGCRKCHFDSVGFKNQSVRRDKNPFPQWFIDDLEGSPDKEAVLNGTLKMQDIARFVCKTHGVYEQKLYAHLAGHSCFKCSIQNRAESLSNTVRTKNPFPQWFIDDLEGSPDKEAVLNGTLKSHDKAQFYCPEHGFYSQLITNHLNQGQSCPSCLKISYSSKREEIIAEFLSNKGIKVIRNDRNVLSNEGGYELDLYLPTYKVAFEFNGYLFHCSGTKTKHGYGGKSKYYHRLKTELCLKKGIKLYHIWEDCSDELCLSIVKAKLGMCERVYARKCEIIELSKEKEKEFFEVNHVDGFTKSLKCYALVNKGVIECALSLRNNFSNQLEIARFASRVNIEVVGGYSKLIKHVKDFMKEIGVKELITYCNRDLSPDPHNNFYSNHGFTFEKECSLIMNYYSIDYTEVRSKAYKPHQLVSRFNLRKQILIDELGSRYKEGMSELECIELLSFRPVYNSGNFKYRIKL